MADASPLVVVVAKPATPDHPPDGLGFTVTVGDTTYDNAADALKGLIKAGDDDAVLVILLDRHVPVDAIPTVASLASKAFHFSDVRLFVFDRKGMMTIPGYKWGGYSEDPEVLRERWLANPRK